MIKPIENNFAAYVTFRDKPFFVTVNENLCKFFPREGPEQKIAYCSVNIKVDNGDLCEQPGDMSAFVAPSITDTPGFIRTRSEDLNVFSGKIEKQLVHGFDENANDIAFIIESLGWDFLPWSCYAAFRTPVIIKGQLKDLETFDAITFSGSVIDSMYPPGRHAINMKNDRMFPIDGARTIEIRPFDDYTKKSSFEIFSVKCTLLYSVAQGGYNLESGELGKLFSIMRLEFDAKQEITTIERYYVLISKFVAFCVAQHNIEFDSITLSRKNDSGDYVKIGICKFFYKYEHIKLEAGTILSFRVFGENIIDALKLFADEKNAPQLAFLPGSNFERNRVSSENIKNLCTAFEFEYSRIFLPPKGVRVSAADKICAIRDKVIEILNSVPDSYVPDYYILPREHLSTDSFIFKYINIQDEYIRNFVKIRNDITHGNFITELGNTGMSYCRLCMVIYLCILSRVGLSGEQLLTSLETIYWRWRYI